MTHPQDEPNTAETRAAKADITELIVAERLARDTGDWDRMATYYGPDSSVEITWFNGTGAEFAKASSQVVNQQDAPNFHLLAPSLVTLNGTRALAETPCSMRSFTPLEGVDCCIESFVRLLWRARRDERGRWLLAGLRCLYIRDLLHACNPAQVPPLDQARLASFRQSYRYLSYNLTAIGLTPRDDLPGTDLPETVAALRAGEAKWLGEA